MCRAALQLPTYATTGALREFRASSCLAVDMNIKLLFAKHLLTESRNNLFRNIVMKELKKQ